MFGWVSNITSNRPNHVTLSVRVKAFPRLCCAKNYQNLSIKKESVPAEVDATVYNIPLSGFCIPDIQYTVALAYNFDRLGLYAKIQIDIETV